METLQHPATEAHRSQQFAEHVQTGTQDVLAQTETREWLGLLRTAERYGLRNLNYQDVVKAHETAGAEAQKATDHIADALHYDDESKAQQFSVILSAKAKRMAEAAFPVTRETPLFEQAQLYENQANFARLIMLDDESFENTREQWEKLDQIEYAKEINAAHGEAKRMNRRMDRHEKIQNVVGKVKKLGRKHADTSSIPVHATEAADRVDEHGQYMLDFDVEAPEQAAPAFTWRDRLTTAYWAAQLEALRVSHAYKQAEKAKNAPAEAAKETPAEKHEYEKKKRRITKGALAGSALRLTMVGVGLYAASKGLDMNQDIMQHNFMQATGESLQSDMNTIAEAAQEQLHEVIQETTAEVGDVTEAIGDTLTEQAAALEIGESAGGGHEGGDREHHSLFSAEAKRIHKGEGLFETFKQMGIPKSEHEQLLREVGPKLEKMGIAYRDHKIGGFGINMTEDGKMPKKALEVISKAAAHRGAHV